ncbi:MAG TPA: transcriptional repressor LexA, partial [Bryobacteraceae bacterium]|nr:transcriptional repressor LexA [Bryobacteraceae bacterium]
ALTFVLSSPTIVCNGRAMALTKRQKEVLDFLIQFIESHGYSPSYEEIATGLELASLATVHKHVAALESKSYVRRGFNQSRSLEVSSKYLSEYRRNKPAAAPPEVPLLGRIAAGRPVEAISGDEKLQFTDFTGKGDTYALEVRGESMIEDHICSGDFVLVERTADVRDGEIAVALVDGSDATLKRIYREPAGRIRLQPANSSMQPIYADAAAVQIQGRVLAVLRKFK